MFLICLSGETDNTQAQDDQWTSEAPLGGKSFKNEAQNRTELSCMEREQALGAMFKPLELAQPEAHTFPGPFNEMGHRTPRIPTTLS